MIDPKEIRPMTDEEKQRAKEKATANRWHKCKSCGGPAASDWCEFCLKEE